MILAIDTSGEFASVALLNADVLKAEVTHRGRGTAEILPSLISDVLKLAHCEINSVSLIAVANGPGSFTGIRTGLAAAHGLSFGLGVPLIGVSVLFARAVEHLKGEENVTVTLPANRQEIYCCKFSLGNSKFLECDGIEIKEKGFVPANGRAVDVSEENLSRAPAEFIGLAATSNIANVPNFLRERVGSGEALVGQYVKGVNAKTLVERGLKAS